jgi:SAM-dependent methyltransferase
MSITSGSPDATTARAFSTSWNNLPQGSVYTKDQVEDWFAPLGPEDFRGKAVLELGCGSASLLVHLFDYDPVALVGVDLGASVLSAKCNMETAARGRTNWQIFQDDLCAFVSDGFLVCYCIGVLQHLKNPHAGFLSVLRNTLPGGRFHCWVYGYEGNLVVRTLVEPLRRICSRLPWWFTKYAVATPLAALYFLYAKALRRLPESLAVRAPLGTYSLWIARRGFPFFRHVAFDQLVTPQTAYIKRKTLEAWLAASPEIDPASVYIIQRNGNSWKFGGRKRHASA